MSKQKSVSRLALLASLAVPACLALAPAASAAKRSGGSTSGGGSLALVMVADKNGNGLPNWGDTVTFEVSTTAPYPSVTLECFQNGTEVDSQRAGFFPSYMFSKEYVLESRVWSGGPADCTATLSYTTKSGTARTLATLSFHVEA